MERNEILKRVEEIFREELEQEDIVLTDETTADDVDGWDNFKKKPEINYDLHNYSFGKWEIYQKKLLQMNSASLNFE